MYDVITYIHCYKIVHKCGHEKKLRLKSTLQPNLLENISKEFIVCRCSSACSLTKCSPKWPWRPSIVLDYYQSEVIMYVFGLTVLKEQGSVESGFMVYSRGQQTFYKKTK